MSRGRLAASGLKMSSPASRYTGSVLVTENAATLYETWVGWGGEGIVLKEPSSI